MAPRSWRAKERARRSARSPGAPPATCSRSPRTTARPASSISDESLLLGGAFGRRRQRVVGQPVPDLASPEQRDAEISPHLELLAVRAEPHQRAIHLAVARIHDGAVLVAEPVALHVLDQREPEHRLAPLVALAPVADPGLLIAGLLAGLREHLDDVALVDPVALADLEPAFSLAGILVHLLPQPDRAGLGGRQRHRANQDSEDDTRADQILQRRS